MLWDYPHPKGLVAAILEAVAAEVEASAIAHCSRGGEPPHAVSLG